MPPSRASTALSAMSTTTASTSSSCKSHCYDAYLIPDSFELPAACPTSAPARQPTPGLVATDRTVPSSTDSSRKSSSWEIYLLETSQHREELDVDRCRMRNELLTSMKAYYGNKDWDKVPCFGDDGVEYVADEPKYQDYTDQIVLFGEERNRFRRRYMDRRGFQVPTKEFDIVKVDAEGNPRPGLVRRITNRMKR